MKNLVDCKVLIVDDSKPIYLMVKEMLDGEVKASEWAKNGQVALDKIAENDYDVILLDWNMPVVSGPEFLEINRAENRTSTPVVMMTTENGPDYIKKALELGAAEYIMKPFSKDILISKIEFIFKG
jgi:two-component system chemotaxis response regulator CheY